MSALLPTALISETVTAPDIAEDITSGVHDIIRLALQRATFLLKYGTPDQQLKLSTTVLGALTRTTTQATTSTTRELRASFETLMSEMTAIPAHTPLVTDSEILDVEVSAIAQDSNYQDEGDGLYPFGLGAPVGRPHSL